MILTSYPCFVRGAAIAKRDRGIEALRLVIASVPRSREGKRAGKINTTSLFIVLIIGRGKVLSMFSVVDEYFDTVEIQLFGRPKMAVKEGLDLG